MKVGRLPPLSLQPPLRPASETSWVGASGPPHPPLRRRGLSPEQPQDPNPPSLLPSAATSFPIFHAPPAPAPLSLSRHQLHQPAFLASLDHVAGRNATCPFFGLSCTFSWAAEGSEFHHVTTQMLAPQIHPLQYQLPPGLPSDLLWCPNPPALPVFLPSSLLTCSHTSPPSAVAHVSLPLRTPCQVQTSLQTLALFLLSCCRR